MNDFRQGLKEASVGVVRGPTIVDPRITAGCPSAATLALVEARMTSGVSGPAIFDGHVLAFDVPGLGETLAEGVHKESNRSGRLRIEHAHPDEHRGMQASLATGPAVAGQCRFMRTRPNQ